MADGVAQAFTAARERAAAAARAGGANAGVEAARVLSGEVDAIIIDVAGREVAKCKTPVAIFATGGFGRGELAPFSDLDLLVLCAKTPGNDVQKLAEAILYPLWDAKVDAGHAVRAYDQALALPANDLAAATALLDARFLTGDRALADKFLAAFRARVAKTAAEDFVARLRAEQKERHSRFGDTIFLLEPDLKNGPGGLRDLCVGRWAAMARFGTSDPKQLLAQGVMTGRLAQAFTAATEWLMRVRILMHATAGRRQDHLRFALQEGDRADPVSGGARSRRRHPAGRPPGGGGADAPVPRARQADSQRDRTAAPARVRARGQAPEDPARDGAAATGWAARRPTRTSSCATARWSRSIRASSSASRRRCIRIFQLAIDLDVPLALRTREQLGELAASQPALLREDAEAGRRFVEICCDARDRANPSRLEQMQDLGILAAIMPEWEPSTGRVQHDIYHVYTVDQHALYAVGRLHALQRGDHAAAFPVPTETVPRGHASGRAGDRDAAARRGQAVRQPAQRDRRGPGGGDLPPAGNRGGGHAAGRVPGAPAPGHGPDVAAAGSGGPGDDLGLRRRCAATRRTCASCTC